MSREPESTAGRQGSVAGRRTRRQALASLAAVLPLAGCLRLTEASNGTSTATGHAPVLAGSFPEFGYDPANTGAIDRPAGPTGLPDVHQSGPMAGPSAPVVGDGDVFVGNPYGDLLAIRDGAVRWSKNLGLLEPVRSSPALADDLVVVGDLEGHLRAFSLDGTEQWRSPPLYPDDGGDPAAVHTDPTVVSGAVICGGADGRVHALDLADGERIWSRRVGDGSISPAVGDGRVFAGAAPGDGADDGGVHALSLSDGSDVWSMGTDVDFSGNPPALARGRVFVASRSGTLYALDAEDGVPQWSRDLNGEVRHCSPAVHDGTVYLGDTFGRLDAIDAADGTVRWTDRYTDGIVASPVVTDHSVYASDVAGAVTRYDVTDGSTVWQREVGGPVKTGIAVLEESIVVASGNEGLQVLR